MGRLVLGIARQLVVGYALIALPIRLGPLAYLGLVREGGVVILSHPTQWEFHPVHHPSYIDFFEQVLPDTTDPVVMGQKWEKQYAEDEWYRHLYRTGYAYHGVHPFYMWYWASHGMAHLGRTIVVGGNPRAVRRLGFTPASTMDDAFEIVTVMAGKPNTTVHTPYDESTGFPSSLEAMRARIEEDARACDVLGIADGLVQQVSHHRSTGSHE